MIKCLTQRVTCKFKISRDSPKLSVSGFNQKVPLCLGVKTRPPSKPFVQLGLL